jgi:hypothetical protein
MREVAGLLIVAGVLAVAPAVKLSSPIWWVVAVSLVIVALRQAPDAVGVSGQKPEVALPFLDP